MPEQTADITLSAALLESQIRNIRLRTIEVRLQDEIDELKASWLTPKAAQKATVLGSAKALVTKLMRDGEKEQKRFAAEIIVTPTGKAREAMRDAGMEITERRSAI